MSDRGSFRARGGGARGGRGPRGGGGGGAPPHHQDKQSQEKDKDKEKPKKENILDLTKYMDKEVNVKFNGGREGEFGSYYIFLFLSFFIYIHIYL